MQFGILGPLTVADGEQPIVVPGAKPRALLVLHAGRVVPHRPARRQPLGRAPAR